MNSYYGERVTKRIDEQGDFTFLKWRKSKWLWVEIAVLLLCPIPGYDFYVS